jgi:hypothetical protein
MVNDSYVLRRTTPAGSQQHMVRAGREAFEEETKTMNGAGGTVNAIQTSHQLFFPFPYLLLLRYIGCGLHWIWIFALANIELRLVCAKGVIRGRASHDLIMRRSRERGLACHGPASSVFLPLG